MKRILFAFIFLAGCGLDLIQNQPESPAGKFGITIKHDDFNGYTTYRTTNNYIEYGFPTSTPAIALEAGIFETKDGKIIYSLTCLYVDRSWIFIESGESLIMLIDGERVGFSGNGSIRNREVYPGHILEIAVYTVNLSDLEKIVNAKEVRIKLIGGKSFVERKLTQTNIEQFKLLLNEYAKHERPRPPKG